MNLKEQVQAAIKKSMKEKDSPRTSALKLLVNEFLNEDKKVGKQRTYEELTLSWKKKLYASMESFTDVEVKKILMNEVKVIEEFCPKQMNKDEITESINIMLDAKDISSVDMKAMKVIMTKLKGLADGKLVREIVLSWNG